MVVSTLGKVQIAIYENKHSFFTLFELHLAKSKKHNTFWSTSQCTYSSHVLRQHQMTPNSGGCNRDQSWVSRIRHTGLEGYPLAQRLPCSCSLLHASISPLSFKGSRWRSLEVAEWCKSLLASDLCTEAKLKYYVLMRILILTVRSEATRFTKPLQYRI